MAKAPKKGVTTAEPQAAKETVKPKTPTKTAVAAKPAAAASKKPAAPTKPVASAKTPSAKATATPAAKSRPRKAAAPWAATPEQRYRMVQEAAYYIAEKHGFTGDNHAFWLQAEQEIDAKLGG